jgi:hypothetical protein
MYVSVESDVCQQPLTCTMALLRWLSGSTAAGYAFRLNRGVASSQTSGTARKDTRE